MPRPQKISQDLAGGKPGETRDVIVQFQPGKASHASIQAVGGQVKADLSVVNGVLASLPTRALEALAKNPNVTYISPDYQVSGSTTFLGTNLSGWGATATERPQNLHLGWTRVFGPRLVNEARVTYGRVNPFFTPEADAQIPRIQITGMAFFGLFEGIPRAVSRIRTNAAIRSHGRWASTI